jgi:hypothetical protein
MLELEEEGNRDSMYEGCQNRDLGPHQLKRQAARRSSRRPIFTANLARCTLCFWLRAPWARVKGQVIARRDGVSLVMRHVPVCNKRRAAAHLKARDGRIVMRIMKADGSAASRLVDTPDNSAYRAIA